MNVLLPSFPMGHYLHAKLDEWCHPQSPHSRVDRAFASHRTTLHETSCGMWFEALESTNHMSSKLEVLVGPEADMEFTLCLITNIPP